MNNRFEIPQARLLRIPVDTHQTMVLVASAMLDAKSENTLQNRAVTQGVLYGLTSDLA